jgi:hypothetical protein
MDEKMIVYRVLVGKPKGKRHVGRSKRRFDVNNKMYVRKGG